MGRRQQQRKVRKKAYAEAVDTPKGNEASRAEAGTPSPIEPPAHALGDHWAVRPGGKGERENAKLISQALRWKTNADADTFKESAPERLTVKELAVLVTRQGLIAGDSRAKAHHVGNVLRMEGQNQRDELSLIEPPAAPLTDQLIRQLLTGMAAVNDDANAIEAVYRVADPKAVVVLPGVNGDDVGAEHLANGEASRLRRSQANGDHRPENGGPDSAD